jgi:hypothetical protein
LFVFGTEHHHTSCAVALSATLFLWSVLMTGRSKPYGIHWPKIHRLNCYCVGFASEKNTISSALSYQAALTDNRSGSMIVAVHAQLDQRDAVTGLEYLVGTTCWTRQCATTTQHPAAPARWTPVEG